MKAPEESQGVWGWRRTEAGEENHLEIIKLSCFKKSRNLVGKSEEHKLKNVLTKVENLSTDKKGLCEDNEAEHGVRQTDWPN